MIGFIGPDGVGKSTLLSILSGVKIIQTGEVEVLNGDIKTKNIEKKFVLKLLICQRFRKKFIYDFICLWKYRVFCKTFGQDKKRKKSKNFTITKKHRFTSI